MKKYIVITRPEKENKKLSEKLKKLGYAVLSYPTIEIKENKIAAFHKDLEEADWLIFTSKNGVRFFLERIDKKLIKKKKIAAVGPKTAQELEKSGVIVNFIPSEFTTQTLGKEIPIQKGEKILLPRASIASPKLSNQLMKRGAKVINLPIYKTTFLESEILDVGKIALVTFTSPSTIKGFVKNKDKEIYSIPVLAIGPVTARAARKFGFKLVYTADTFTTEGMIEKLKEIL